MTDNPLKVATRLYPIDMIFARKRSVVSKIKFPDDYEVDYLPEKVEISRDLFELTFSVKELHGYVEASISYHFKKSIYQPSDYKRVQHFF